MVKGRFSHGLSGSSPLVRGTALADILAGGFYRFIPARAGNSHPVIAHPPCRAVHPRSCGEQSSIFSEIDLSAGSSPLVRGTGKTVRGRRGSFRFIPARAGNRTVAIIIPPPNPVHPRSCGEQSISFADATPEFGSSPLVRGTVCEFNENCFRLRFIPARAGNRRS